MMENSTIPRMTLETFATDGYTVPLLHVEHYSLDSQYFVIRNRDNYPVKDYISPHRRKFYKIFHMTRGTGVLTIGLHRYEIGPNEIAFLHPDEIMSWQTTSTDTGGHFCLIHPDYFGMEAEHVRPCLSVLVLKFPFRFSIVISDKERCVLFSYTTPSCLCC
jgi:hypothetical protein